LPSRAKKSFIEKFDVGLGKCRNAGSLSVNVAEKESSREREKSFLSATYVEVMAKDEKTDEERASCEEQSFSILKLI
jgi:hypothetical protein